MEMVATARDASHKGNHAQQQESEKSYEEHLEHGVE
jgi:hypothetical protein